MDDSFFSIDENTCRVWQVNSLQQIGLVLPDEANMLNNLVLDAPQENLELTICKFHIIRLIFIPRKQKPQPRYFTESSTRKSLGMKLAAAEQGAGGESCHELQDL